MATLEVAFCFSGRRSGLGCCPRARLTNAIHVPLGLGHARQQFEAERQVAAPAGRVRRTAGGLCAGIGLAAQGAQARAWARGVGAGSHAASL